MLTAARAAAANDAEECASAAEKTQVLRDATKLVEARRQVLVCQRDRCPAVVRSDCERWLGEIDAAMPTVVFRAEDAAGSDLADVTVSLDGAAASRLDGVAARVDPGTHHLVFHARGLVDVQQDLLVAQGEKNRRVLVHFAAPAPAPVPVAKRSPWPWVATGVAAAGLVSFGVFGGLALAKHGDLDDSCVPTRTCSSSDKDALFARGLVADVSLGIAIVAGGIATWLFLHPPASARTATRFGTWTF